MSFNNRILNKIKNLLESSSRIHEEATISRDAVVLGSKIGKNTSIYKNVVVSKSDLSGEIQIGSDSKITSSIIKGEVSIGNNAKINHCTLLGKITIGRYSSLWGPNLDIHSNQNAGVLIGNFCSIARNVSFQTFNHNFKKSTSYFIGQNFFNEKWENEKVTKGAIILKNDVWIGTHCVILNGITIENGAIVAANSVVTKDVPPYGIVAGSPAKLIGYRFEPTVIKQLEELAWWDWSDEKISENKTFFENEISEETISNVKYE